MLVPCCGDDHFEFNLDKTYLIYFYYQLYSLIVGFCCGVVCVISVNDLTCCKYNVCNIRN
jgi:hypothetical protein